MGKTRDLFKKIRDTRGAFHAKMGIITDRNSSDLTESRRYEEEVKGIHRIVQKDLHDPDNHHGVITHLELDIPGMQNKLAFRKHHYKQS